MSLETNWGPVLRAGPLAVSMPVCGTGASDAIAGLEPVRQALAGCHFIADGTVEGPMHAPGLPQRLAGAGHIADAEQPAALNAAVVSFLRRHVPAS